jgi:transcriptional regulator with XRE-family HTH domain
LAYEPFVLILEGVPGYAHDMEAGQLVKRARADARLSVRRLAVLAGVSPSSIVRIESGQVDPTVGMLRTVLAAAGRDLRVTTTRRRTITSTTGALSDGRVALANLNTAWRRTAFGDSPDWTRFRAVLDQLALHPEAIPRAIRKPPVPSGSDMVDTLLAGIAETLADDTNQPRPAWTRRVPALECEWATPGTPEMLRARRASTPVQLRERRLVLDEATLWRDRNMAHA